METVLFVLAFFEKLAVSNLAILAAALVLGMIVPSLGKRMAIALVWLYDWVKSLRRHNEKLIDQVLHLSPESARQLGDDLELRVARMLLDSTPTAMMRRIQELTVRSSIPVSVIGKDPTTADITLAGVR